MHTNILSTSAIFGFISIDVSIAKTLSGTKNKVVKTFPLQTKS